eukprot:4104877-Alexandrium_andersonii.AAC.1
MESRTPWMASLRMLRTETLFSSACRNWPSGQSKNSGTSATLMASIAQPGPCPPGQGWARRTARRTRR